MKVIYYGAFFLSVFLIQGVIFPINWEKVFPLEWIGKVMSSKQPISYSEDPYGRFNDFLTMSDPLDMQKQAENALKEACDISDEVWDKTQKELGRKKLLLTQSRADYIHDKTIPDKMMERVLYLLKKYGIEPTSIDIIRKDQEPKPNVFCVFAAVKGSDNDLSVLYVNCLLLNKLPLAFLDAVMVHEIGHLVNSHHFFEKVLTNYLLQNDVWKQTQNEWNLTIKKFEELKNANFFIQLINKWNGTFQQIFADIEEQSKKIKEQSRRFEATKKVLNSTVYRDLKKTHEYVADQYYAYADDEMRIKMLFFKAVGINPQAPRLDYPSGNESFISYFKNIIKPRVYRYLLMCLFNEFTPVY